MPHQKIIGHARQLAELSADIDSKNVAHAYLFAGTPNLGKTTVAQWFARELLTQGKTAEEKEEIDHQIARLVIIIRRPGIVCFCRIQIPVSTGPFPHFCQDSCHASPIGKIKVQDASPAGNPRFNPFVLRAYE